MHSSDPRLFAKALAALQNARYEDAERDFKKILRGEPKHFGALNLYAILLMQTGRVGEAEPLLRKATAVDSRSDATFYNLGLALKQLRKPAEALDALDKSIALKPNNPESWNNRGTVCNDLGRYAEAIQDFDRALALNPAYAEALSNRGRSLLLLEQYEESAAAYDGAIKINPNLPEAWIGRGTVQFRLKRWDDALAALQTAITLRSNFLEAWVGAGNTFLELRRHDDAIRAFETAINLNQGNAAAWTGLANARYALGDKEGAKEASDIAIKTDPEAPDVLIGRGNLLARLGTDSEALPVFEAVLERHPNLVDALIGRGNILKNQKRFSEAIAAYDCAIAAKPSSAEAKVGRGNVLSDMKRYDEALIEYDEALRSSPQLAEGWLGRGLIFTKRKEFDAAMEAFHTALDLRPNFVEAWTGQGYLLNLLERRDEALTSYDRAIELNPRMAEAWLGRGSVLGDMKNHHDAQAAFEKVLEFKPDLPFVLGDLLHTKALNCDWTNQQEEWADCLARIEQNSPVAATLQSLTFGTTPAQQLACAKLYAADNYAEILTPLFRGEAFSHRRMKIAYLSTDLRSHPVAHLSAGVFENHDRSRFETIAVSVGGDDGSSMRSRMRLAFDSFIDGQTMSNHALAGQLRELEVDIIVDLGGHTAGSRIDLLAYRPAPVQAAFLGYPGTTGTDFVDYIIADPVVIPPDHQPFFSEKVAYLPDCYLPNDRTRMIAAAPSRADAGLPETGVVFCSFNQPYKITPAIFNVWMRLLAKVPGSVLWLPALSGTATANLRKEAEQRGIASERLVFAKRVDHQEDHLARLGLADLFLDTLNYNAHSTACDALWAGVPLITCIGSAFAGRVGASVLKAMGLPELVVTSLDDYEALALKLASEPALLASTKAKLMAQRLTAPLFDTERFTRNLEALYLKMWERAQAGEPPAPLSL